MNTQMTDSNTLLQSLMQGRLDCFRSCSIHSPLPGAAFQKNDNGSVYCSSGIEYPLFNGVMADKESIPSNQEIEEAVAFFKDRKLPFIWWTAAKKLEDKGFQFAGTLTGIALDIPNSISNHFSEIEIKVVHSEKDMSLFATLAAAIFEMNGKVPQQFQRVMTAVQNHQEQKHFLATVDGVAVGTATLCFSSSSAGIWNLATLPEYRKRGVGTALLSAALIEAKKQGRNHAMAILMPDGMAWGLFTQLGFKEVCHFPFYLYAKEQL